MSLDPRLSASVERIRSLIRARETLEPQTPNTLPNVTRSKIHDKAPRTDGPVLDYPPTMPTGSTVGSKRRYQDNTPRLTLDISELANRVVARAPELPEGSRRLYRVLVEVALTVARHRRYPVLPGQVSYFAPLEVVAAALGVHRTTVWRHLGPLLAAGLVAYRVQKTTYREEARNTGCVWSVRLLGGKSARVALEDIRHQWRDFAGDMRANRLARYAVQHILEAQLSQTAVQLITEWAIPPANSTTRDSVYVANSLAYVLDVPYAPWQERAAFVERSARAVCVALGDDWAASGRVWTWALWQLLRLKDRGQDYFNWFYNLLTRCEVDRAEGWAKNAGALALQRMRESGLMDALRSAPQTRVTSRKAAA